MGVEGTQPVLTGVPVPSEGTTQGSPKGNHTKLPKAAGELGLS